MSKQKRFKTRQQIILAITRLQESFDSRCKEAEHLGKSADKGFSEAAIQSNPADAEQLIKNAQFNRAKQKKLERLNSKIPNKLESLKHTLAAFDTQPMPFLDSQTVVNQG